MVLEGIVKAAYGEKRAGRSKFVIVAPHGAGDDLYSKGIAKELARILDAYCVVNDQFKKPKAWQRANSIMRRVDFNNLRQKKECEEMRQFYDDIAEYCRQARQYAAGQHNGKQRALVVYIHGMRNRGSMGMDIGIGMKWNKHQQKYQGSDEHPAAGRNSGVPRANVEMAVGFRRGLDQVLQGQHRKRAWMGKRFPAWDRRNGIQYHAGSQDHSMQIEICRDMRREGNYKQVAAAIAQALLQNYARL
ncbi:hypothetical protein JXB28_01315 [Candidatus Woesearchaeota archaeon]|nr:hypothetical protein [Candidatus Woesearchaeota archaeon]